MRRGCFGTGKSYVQIVECMACGHDAAEHKDGRCGEIVDAYQDTNGKESVLVNVYCKCSPTWIAEARGETLAKA